MAWLFGIIFIVLFAVLFLYLRRRRSELIEEEEARAQAFFELVHGEAFQGKAGDVAAPIQATQAAGNSVQSVSGVVVPPPPAPLAAPVAVADDGVSPGGPLYLERPHQLVWRWLRTTLPNHECFARGSLRRVVGRERAHKDMLLDFVICDIQCRVVAVIDLERRNQDPAIQRFKRELLSEAGVRYACWNASELPERRFVQDWVLQAPSEAQEEIER